MMMSVPEFFYSCTELIVTVESSYSSKIKEDLFTPVVAERDGTTSKDPADVCVGIESTSTRNGFKKNHADKNSIEFDETLSVLWDAAQTKGLFRYQFRNPQSKILSERYRYILQLNPDRFEKRRKPQEIASLKQPFNPNEFNFNKVNPEEIILKLRPWYSRQDSKSPEREEEHLLIINVSPLEYGHVLLTPFRNKNNPQKTSSGGLRLAIELALLSRSCDFRVGFNSLCGYASVNHEHYHAYYLKHRLYLESAALVKICGPCYELVNYPAPGFGFVLLSAEESVVQAFVGNVLKLTSYLQENNVAHNIFITRGSSLRTKGHFDSLRVFVWARSSSFGAKGCEAFNPALCELGGHFPCKNETAYETLTEEFIIQELGDICKETFAQIRNVIADIL